MIGVLLVLYAVCTVAMVPAMAPIDFTKLTPRTLATGPMLLLLAIEGVYSAVGVALLVTYLVWYGGLVDWARGRGITVPATGVAMACWLVPFVNFVHPFRTIRRIQKGVGVKAPVVWWWSLFWGSIVLSTGGTARLAHGGYDAVFTVASFLEVVAAYLCWVVVRAFTRADESWIPLKALAQRDAGLAKALGSQERGLEPGRSLTS